MSFSSSSSYGEQQTCQETTIKIKESSCNTELDENDFYGFAMS